MQFFKDGNDWNHVVLSIESFRVPRYSINIKIKFILDYSHSKIRKF